MTQNAPKGELIMIFTVHLKASENPTNSKNVTLAYDDDDGENAHKYFFRTPQPGRQ